MTSTSLAGGKQQSVIQASSNCVPYPPPQTTYEDIIANPDIFMASLEKLHSIMGTKFMIPIIGGKELDLHRLFIEVTSRGGIEKVIRERRWKEVTSVFNFPSTATNASFVLRKYYLSLLHHFEQIYFFKAVGWTPTISDSSPCPSAAKIPTRGMTSMLPPSDYQSAYQHPRTTATELPAGASSSASPAGGFPVTGVIDGKFDSGYLVTVTIGTEMLKGVLYQSPPEQPAQQVLQPCGVLSKDGATSTPPNALRRRRRKKSEIKRRDPSHPKPNRSGYNFFFAEQHARLKPLYPGKDREISRMIGEHWNKLQDSERTVYQEKATKDKERYRMEMEDYKEKLRTGLIISDAVPLQQCLPESDLNMVHADKNEETTEAGDSLSPDNDTSYVEGDSGEYRTEEKEEEEEEEMEDDSEEDDASPQGVGNLDINILAEEEPCEMRTAKEDVRKETSTVGDDKNVNILVEEEQCEMRTAEEDVRKETSTVGDDKNVNILVEEKQCEMRAAEEDVREETSTVGDNKNDNILVEEEQCEMRTAEEDVRKETSTVGDNKNVNILFEEEQCEMRTAEEDVREETSTVGDDKNVNILVEEEQCEMRTTEEDVRKETSTVDDDKDINILVEEEHCETRPAEEDVRKETSTVDDANILVEEEHCETRTAEEEVRKETSTVGDDKEVFAGDTVMVEAEEEPEPEPESKPKPEPEPTTAMRED